MPTAPQTISNVFDAQQHPANMFGFSPGQMNYSLLLGGLGLLGGQGRSGQIQGGMQGLMAGTQMDAQNRARMEQQQKEQEQRAALEGVLPTLPGMTPEASRFLTANPEAGAQAVAGRLFPTPPSPTDDMREFEFAKSQGFQGTLQDWIIQNRQAGRSQTNVNVGQSEYGTIPPGYRLDQDKKGGMSMSAIPGGPAAQELEAAGATAEAGQQQDVDKASTMLGLVSNLREEITNADTPATGTLSTPFSLYSGTSAGRVRSYTRALQSGVALNAMMRLKQASATGATGFGAMNAKELDLLINDIGALDPNTTEPDIFLQTLDEIEARAQRVIADIQRNVSPERIRELGLDQLLNSGIGGSGSGAPPDVDPDLWELMEPEDRMLWQN